MSRRDSRTNRRQNDLSNVEEGAGRLLIHRQTMTFDQKALRRLERPFVPLDPL